MQSQVPNFEQIFTLVSAKDMTEEQRALFIVYVFYVVRIVQRTYESDWRNLKYLPVHSFESFWILIVRV
jgi:hypothetical protein